MCVSFLVTGLLPGSLVAKGDEGVGAKGAARGNVVREERDDAESDGNHEEGLRVARANAEEKMGKVAREGEGSGNAEGGAHEGEAGALAENEAKDVLVLRAEGDANADFVGALGDRVGHDAVDADDGESKCDGGESAERGEIEALVAGGGGGASFLVEGG